MKGEKKQTFQQATTYGWQAPPESADVEAVRGLKLEVDPRIDAAFGRRKQALSEGFNNPLGSYTTPAVREAVETAGRQQLEQEQAETHQAAHHDLQGVELARRTAVAEMTAPRMVQTGQSGTQTVPSQGGLGSSAIGAAGTVGSALLL